MACDVQSVFERKETKYRLHADQYRAILAALEGRLAPDAYGSTVIKSAYFDTEDRDMVARSLEKPFYKEKLRVRGYGSVAKDDTVFVEIKKKYDGVVYKRRMGMSYAAARAYLDGMPYEEARRTFPAKEELHAACVLREEEVQVAREVDALALRWGTLSASIVTSCVRTAYGPIGPDGFGCSDEDGLRITFDSSLAYCDLRASRRSSSFFPLIGPEEVIMEIKVRGSYPKWLADVLAQCHAYPCSFSKYGEAYKRCMQGGAEHAGNKGKAMAACA